MSGHSKWHSIKHQKGKTDAQRGKLREQLAALGIGFALLVLNTMPFAVS